MELPSIAEASSKFYRQYSITSANDAEAIENGRCPSYAVNWPLAENRLHWPQGHDYYLGNGENINDNKELREILSKKLATSQSQSQIQRRDHRQEPVPGQLEDSSEDRTEGRHELDPAAARSPDGRRHSGASPAAGAGP